MPSKVLQLAGFVLILSLTHYTLAQAAPAAPKNPWAFSLITDGYIIPNQDGYASPNFTADHGWLHLEARYNYENLRTG